MLCQDNNLCKNSFVIFRIYRYIYIYIYLESGLFLIITKYCLRVHSP